MADIMTQVDRLQELSGLLIEMCQETNTKRFYELDRKFQELKELNRLEDSLNEVDNDTL